MTAVAIGDRSNFFSHSYSTGSSDASRQLQRLYEGVVVSLRRSVTWDYLGKALDALSETYRECNEQNWDGYDALPISQATYDEAIRFLNALPSWMPTPEIVPEPSGDIGFEWNFGKNRILAASVGGTNRIIYAGLLGTGNKAHGIEVFDGSIPQTLVDHITRIYPGVGAAAG
jgi:hypothetical protein